MRAMNSVLCGELQPGEEELSARLVASEEEQVGAGSEMDVDGGEDSGHGRGRDDGADSERDVTCILWMNVWTDRLWLQKVQ